jgi:drug/metabolite transporter (DMT)-like permease
MPPARPLRGALLCLVALFCFACMDTGTKYLVESYNTPLVMAIRYILNAVLMLAFLGPIHGRQMIESRRTGLVWLRAVCLSIASLFVGLALQTLPVAEMTAIIFLSPMLIVLFARPLLGERIGALGWAASIMGFAGVLCVARPGGTLDAAGIAFTLCAVAANVAYQLLSRLLAGSERAIALAFHAAVAGSLLFGISLPWAWSGEAPSLLQVLVFLGVGATATLGHILFTAAFRHATASVLAPLGYVQLIWAGLLGWLAFDHVPDGVSIVGMLVIIGSGALVALKYQRSRSAPSQPPVAD